MAISAEQLNVILSAKDKEFTRAMDRSQRRVQQFAKQSNKSLGSASKAFGKLSGAAAAFLPALSAAALVGAVRSVTASLDEIGKTADRIGITTDALQLLRVTAESAGVAQSALDSSIEKLGKGLAEAKMGIGTAKDALKTLNLNAADLIGLGLDGAMAKIADEVNKLPSPMEKTAVATQLFGRSGAPMLNLLREGADGMARMQAEARELGVVIDEDLIRNAEEAQTQIDLMSRVISANFSSALINLAPLLTSTATSIASLSRIVSNFGYRSGDMPLGAEELREMAKEYRGLEKELGALNQAQSLYNLNVEKYGETSDAAVKAANRLTAAELELKKAVEGRQAKRNAQDSANANVKNLIKETAELREQARLRGANANETERARIALQRAAYEAEIFGNIQKASGVDLADFTEEQLAQIKNLGLAYEDAAIAASLILNPVKAAGAATKDVAVQAQTAREAYASMLNEMINASPFLQQLGFDAENLESTMGTVESSMESAFMSMIDGTASASDAFKSMAGEIIKELYRVLVVQRIVGAISGAMGGFFNTNQVSGPAMPLGTGNIRPPQRASGGPVKAGQPYVTGEHGRELFVPKVDGRILSGAQTSNAARSGGDGVTIIQNNTFGNGVNRAEVNAMLPKLVQASKAAVLDAKLRGGSYGGAFS
jgi:hypothetical protein